MAVSLTQFRDRYPTAALTSDILMVQGDQFIVKVMIQVPEAAIATGIAASADVEVAEDRARQRALQALGLEAVSTTPRPENAPPVPTTQPPVSSSTAESSEPAIAPSPAVFSVENTTEPVTNAVATTSSSTATDIVERPQRSAPAKAQSVPVSSVSSATHTTAEITEPEPTTAALPAPINLSDVIAQTDIELRRLGWTVESGREYLEATYNKRSRHELSEEELIQFLCHLESLSTSSSVS